MLKDNSIDSLLKKSIQVKRYLPKNFSETDIGLFEHEFEVCINIPPFLHFKNIIVDDKGNCYKYFSKNNINESKFAKKKSGTRHLLAVFKDLINIVFKRNTIHLRKVCWITDDWSNNYFHWFTDVIPKLIYLENQYPEYTVVFSASLLNTYFIKRSLDFIKLNYASILSYEKVFAKEFIGIPNFAPTGNFLPYFTLLTQRKFMPGERTATKNIFVKRKLPLNRRVLNEEEILTIFKKYSFDIIDTEEIEWQEQVALFSETKILIAVHGAALTNMLYMHKGAKVLELRRADDRKNNCYYSLASAMSLDYYYQLCKVDDSKLDTQHNNFYVDTLLLERNIKAILSDV